MSSTLLDAVKTVFTEDLYIQLSVLLGEPTAEIRRTSNAAIPIVLTGILNRSETTDGVAAVHNLARQAVSADLHGQLYELKAGSGGLSVGNALSAKGPLFLRTILEERTQFAIDEAATYGSVKVTSSGFILGLAAFSALDVIGRHIHNENLDVRGLIPWLAAQRDGIYQAIPAGLGVTSALGIKRLPGGAASESSRRYSVVYGILAIIIIIGLLFYTYKTCNKPVNQSTSTDTTSVSSPAPASH